MGQKEECMTESLQAVEYQVRIPNIPFKRSGELKHSRNFAWVRGYFATPDVNLLTPCRYPTKSKPGPSTQIRARSDPSEIEIQLLGSRALHYGPALIAARKTFEKMGFATTSGYEATCLLWVPWERRTKAVLLSSRPDAHPFELQGMSVMPAAVHMHLATLRPLRRPRKSSRMQQSGRIAGDIYFKTRTKCASH